MSGASEKKLEQDLKQCFEVDGVDVLLLCECGEIGVGLPKQQWLAMLRRIVGDTYDIVHQSHYTCLVNKLTVKVLVPPELRGPLSPDPAHHYRMAQCLVVELKDSAGKPIQLVNVHSPACQKHPLTPSTREHICRWLGQNTRSHVLIGGDLKSNLFSLDQEF